MSIELIGAIIFLVSGGTSGACVARALHTPVALRDRGDVGEQLRRSFPAQADAADFAGLIAQLDQIPE